MFKTKVRCFLAGLLAATLLISTLTLASGALREVFYGVNVVVNGEPQHFDDDSQPFILDGRTFLPVRGIAEALGYHASFDGDTNTVYITDAPMEHPIIGQWNVIAQIWNGEFRYIENVFQFTFLPGGEGYSYFNSGEYGLGAGRGFTRKFPWSLHFGVLAMHNIEQPRFFEEYSYEFSDNRLILTDLLQYRDSILILERIEE
ncbi:MAG: copper amine oxidase N-terminal domain-containing protein [Oscillospiraceae bacterium]|nr:copper amine oxidase N-terminal domain-containing protein [Oscillospiraceae bacterium]